MTVCLAGGKVEMSLRAPTSKQTWVLLPRRHPAQFKEQPVAFHQEAALVSWHLLSAFAF
jgi:hypothetical protein